VVVLGDRNVISDDWFDDGDGDNLKFFENLAARCLGGQPAVPRVTRIAVLDESREPDYFTGGVSNSYDAVLNIARARGLVAERITSADIAAGRLDGFTTLVLPDNAPPVEVVDRIVAWWARGNHIIAIDSGITFVLYSGILFPELKGRPAGESKPAYWTYDSSSTIVIRKSQPITAGYSPGQELSAESDDALLVIAKLPSGAEVLAVDKAKPDQAAIVFYQAAGTLTFIGPDEEAYYLKTIIGNAMAFPIASASVIGGARDVTTIVKYLPATYEFSNQDISYHMVHFTDTQPSGTVILGRSCEGTANRNVLLVRSYPGGGTFTYMAFDLGQYGSDADQTAFVNPFLQGFLEYIEAVEGKRPSIVLATPHEADNGLYVKGGLEALGVAFSEVSSYPADGAADLIIIAQDGGYLALPDYTRHLALGHHVLVIGGSNYSPYYESLKLYFNITTDTGWHTCECTPDWIKLK
jgi:hypothetical protein